MKKVNSEVNNVMFHSDIFMFRILPKFSEFKNILQMVLKTTTKYGYFITLHRHNSLYPHTRLNILSERKI